MENLGKLFGSANKVKIMRLFMYHPGDTFELGDIGRKTKLTQAAAKKEVTTLESIKFLKEKSFYKTPISKKTGKPLKRKKVKGWTLNMTFQYLRPLRNMLINNTPLTQDELIKKLSGIGKLQFVVISGIFIQNWDSRIDLLIVGDKLKQTGLDRIIRNLEAQIGKELRYSAFNTKEFQYRINVHDRLIRDILDAPHEPIVDKLGISLKK